MTQIETNKVVTYAAELPIPSVITEKFVTYAAELPIPSVITEKFVAYVAELQELTIVTDKLVTYVAELNDNTGHARQYTLGERPLYKTGTIPHISFGVGTSLEVQLLEETDYVTIVFSSNGTTFTETTSFGSLVTVNQNFNQAAIIQANVYTEVLGELIKANMRQQLIT